MIFVLVAAIGIISARWLSWFSVLVVATVLAIAVGIEGAVETRSLMKVLRRGLEVNATLQGSYLAAACALYGTRLLGSVRK